VAVAVFGVASNNGIAGGSDSYGYVSQADLWLNGSLHIPQPDARHVPWPNGQWTFAPLGYRPAADGDSIVPVYAPGLSMIMAAFKRIAGQCGVAWVSPFGGAVLVLATFWIGRRMFSDAVALAAAWLVATSPTVLMMLGQPMSDVPVAACWALAIYGCVIDTRAGALLAGLAAAAALVIRPNLVVVAAFMGIWIVLRDTRRRPFSFAPSRTVIYGIPVAAACLFIAWINRSLYGSPLDSGYGPLSYIYSPYRGSTNVVRYGSWLITTQTPLMLVGLVAMFVPLRLWPQGRTSIPGRALLGLMVIGVVGAYLFWIIFDAWWYLRFLLAAWPPILVSTAWLLAWPSGRAFSRLGAALVLFMGFYGLWFAHREHLFSFGEGDRRYAIVGRLVRDATPPNSVIFSIQHSGSVRYYGGRMTLRYDFLNQRWLDRAVEWLNRQGMHPYFLLDEWEVEQFQFRFHEVNALAALKVARVWEYRGSPRVFLFDPLEPERPGEKPVIFYSADQKLPSCPRPEPQPTFRIEPAKPF